MCFLQYGQYLLVSLGSFIFIVFIVVRIQLLLNNWSYKDLSYPRTDIELGSLLKEGGKIWFKKVWVCLGFIGNLLSNKFLKAVF